MRILALDYGRARIGVAVQAGTLAEPLLVLPAGEQALHEIAQLCRQYGITQLVVGVSEQDMAQESTTFGVELGKKLGLPIDFTDETLSSVEVQQRLRSAKSGKSAFPQKIDHYAAAVILERYIDDHPEILEDLL